MKTVAIAIVTALLGYVIVAALMGGGDIDWQAFLLVMIIPVGIGLRLWEWWDVARDVRGRSGSGMYPGPDVERAMTDDDHRRSL